MSPLWLVVFLTWYHLSTGSEADDFKGISSDNKEAILQPSEVTQRQQDYEALPIDDFSTLFPKCEHYLAPSDNEDDDLTVYSITYSSSENPYSPFSGEKNRIKRSADMPSHPPTSKHKRSSENILDNEENKRQNKLLTRNNIYDILLHAENPNNINREEFRPNILNPWLKLDVSNKRNAKFYSWGGKRNSIDYVNVPSVPCIHENKNNFFANTKKVYDLNESKRARFSSWGGKRQEKESTGRRLLPFRLWSGKRDKSHILVWPKYTPFKAWGGKRSESVGYIPTSGESLNAPLKKNTRVRRPKFYSWGGKRNDVTTNFIPQQERSILNNRDDVENAPGIPFYSAETWKGEQNTDKRSKFSAWGGKRSPEVADLVIDPGVDYQMDKKTFHSWGGKRATSSSVEPDFPEDDEKPSISFDI